MINFDSVSLCLNNRLILNSLSFHIDPSQTVLLVGSSGAGKSTILRLILRLVKPTTGIIKVMGENIANYSEKKINQLRQKFGLVFQEGALFDSLTIEENVGFFLTENFRLPENIVKARVLNILEFFGLKNYLHYYPSELSGGMKKRVAIARAVVSRPKVLLYDEPTAGLDPLTAKKVVDLISSLKEKFDVTSLIITHEIHHFIESVDKLLMLKNGSISYEGSPDLSILDHFEESQLTIKCN